MKVGENYMTGEHMLMLAALGVGGVLWYIYLRSLISRRK